MEPLVYAAVFTAGAGFVHFVGGALCVLVLAATAVLVASTAAERDSRSLARERAGCATVCGLLVVAGFLGVLSRWALAVACVASLLALLAVALRYGQGKPLRGYLEARGGDEEPAWWPAFERGFSRYASTTRREQNPLQRAVTRQTSHTAGADRGRVARRSPDVMTGERR
jgi:lysylphosphatidylglycerol synthetase-like protein (DUF2156 family)